MKIANKHARFFQVFTLKNNFKETFVRKTRKVILMTTMKLKDMLPFLLSSNHQILYKNTTKSPLIIKIIRSLNIIKKSSESLLISLFL